MKKELNFKMAGVAQNNCLLFFKKLLTDTNWEQYIYISGGFVRDYIKNIESNDLDLVIQKQHGAKQFCNFIINLLDGNVIYEKLNPNYPTYNIKFKDNIQLGNSHFNIKGADVDVSDTAKIRYPQDSNKKQLFVFGNLKDDAMQRDFTINSLFIKLSDNSILDLTNYGLKDIENNLLRLIPNSNKQQNIYNNPKILLRYCRFYAKYKMNVIKQDIQLMSKYNSRIETLTNEQIEKQINKIPAENIQYAIAMMKRIKIFDFISNFL